MLVKRKEEFEVYQEQPAAKPAVVAKPQPKLNKSLRAKCLILIVIFALMAAFTTVRNEYIVSEGYDLVKVKSEAIAVERENERLRLEIAQMKSPQRIQDIAVANLGMTVPEEVYFASGSGN